MTSFLQRTQSTFEYISPLMLLTVQGSWYGQTVLSLSCWWMDRDLERWKDRPESILWASARAGTRAKITGHCLQSSNLQFSSFLLFSFAEIPHYLKRNRHGQDIHNLLHQLNRESQVNSFLKSVNLFVFYCMKIILLWKLINKIKTEFFGNGRVTKFPSHLLQEGKLKPPNYVILNHGAESLYTRA